MRLSALVVDVPETRVPVTECVAASGAPAMEGRAFERLFGMERVAVDVCDGPHPLERLVDRLAERHDGPRPDALLHVHGNPVQHAPGASPAAALLGRHPFLAAVTQAAEMDQQNCSTLFWALAAAGGLLACGAARAVAILAGDSCAPFPMGERYAPGCTALGDAYAALVVDGRPGGTRIGEVTLRARSEFHCGRFGTPEEVAAFNVAHTGLVLEILETLGPGATPDEPLLVHNVNRLCWTQFCRDTGIDPARVRLGLLPGIGHCWTLDSTILLHDMLAAPDRPESAAMLSVGQGGYLGGCRVRPEREGR